MDHWRFPHICEVCGKEELLTRHEAFNAGWDYPPDHGKFGVISPRCCPNCPNQRTLWWAMAVEKYTEDILSERHLKTARRILAKPDDLQIPYSMRP
ncbi:hypothetical protein CHAN_03845 [Corynebacterium hansenii]|nr:hypothetical protein CHAN_03845 [Corynebacterium hansenii]